MLKCSVVFGALCSHDSWRDSIVFNGKYSSVLFCEKKIV